MRGQPASKLSLNANVQEISLCIYFETERQTSQCFWIERLSFWAKRKTKLIKIKQKKPGL